MSMCSTLSSSTMCVRTTRLALAQAIVTTIATRRSTGTSHPSVGVVYEDLLRQLPACESCHMTIAQQEEAVFIVSPHGTSPPGIAVLHERCCTVPAPRGALAACLDDLWDWLVKKHGFSFSVVPALPAVVSGNGAGGSSARPVPSPAAPPEQKQQFVNRKQRKRIFARAS